MGTRQTHFSIFELPARYALDLEDLEQRYREASRHWHPDRFSRAPASERAAVLARATDLNQAYRVLKNPARRAEYLLSLHGVDVASEEPGKQPVMPPAFLAEVIDLREELFEARAARDPARLATLRANIDGRMATLRQTLTDGFLRLENGDSAALNSLVTAVLEQRYYQRFLDEIAAADEAHADEHFSATL